MKNCENIMCGTHEKYGHSNFYGLNIKKIIGMMHHGQRNYCGPGIPFGPDFINQFIGKWQYFMPYDLDETEEEYIITMPLPGFDVKDIEVSVKGNNILIEAKKPDSEQKESEGDKAIKKVTMGKLLWDRPIEVKIPVSEEIDSESVKAKLSKGILKIRFKKIPGKKVNIEE